MTTYTNQLFSIKKIYKTNDFKYHYTEKNVELNIELLFLPQHFYHLSGLHKLVDLRSLRRKAENIYIEILSKKITYNDISKSKFFNDMSDRLIYHREMLNVLHADSLFFKSLHGYFKGITSDCVLTKSVDNEPLFSFLFMKMADDVFFPCSFFTRNEQKEYTKDGTRWKILSITEIKK